MNLNPTFQFKEEDTKQAKQKSQHRKLNMSLTQVCAACNALAVDECLRDLLHMLELEGSKSISVNCQQKSTQRPWHLDLGVVSKSSISCVICKLVLQGLREGRQHLTEATRFSGNWYETPKDFDDDILTIAYYLNGKLNLTIVAWLATEFENDNAMSSKPGTDCKPKAHAIIRVTCSGDMATSMDGYGEISSELRISLKNGNSFLLS